MQRRQFLVRVLATGAAAFGVAAATGTPAIGATRSDATTRLSSAESWLLSTGRRALG
jgi:hypothetical protein